MNEDIFTELGPLLQSVATSMAGRYYRYGADRDDMYQQGALWVADHPSKVSEYMENERYGEKQLAQALRNEMMDYGEELKAQHLGYSRDDVFYYSKNMVRELLPLMFDEEAWLHPETPAEDTERRSPSAPAEGGNWIATLADVSRAYDGLDGEDRDLLGAFHRDSWSNKLLAEAYGVSEQTMSYRHDMAVRRLVTALGGPKPKPEHDQDCEHEWRGWGGRRAVFSNASARAIQENAWDEGS